MLESSARTHQQAWLVVASVSISGEQKHPESQAPLHPHFTPAANPALADLMILTSPQSNFNTNKHQIYSILIPKTPHPLSPTSSCKSWPQWLSQQLVSQTDPEDRWGGLVQIKHGSVWIPSWDRRGHQNHYSGRDPHTLIGQKR